MSSSTILRSNSRIRCDENARMSSSSSRGLSKTVAFSNAENRNVQSVNFSKTKKTPLKTSSLSQSNMNASTPARRALGDISNRNTGLADGGSSHNTGGKNNVKKPGLKIHTSSLTNQKSGSQNLKKTKSVKKNLEADVIVALKNIKIDDDDENVSDIELPAGGSIYDPSMDDPLYALPPDDDCAIDIQLTRETMSQLHLQFTKNSSKFELEENFQDMYRKEMEDAMTFQTDFGQDIFLDNLHSSYKNSLYNPNFMDDGGLYDDALLSDSDL